MRLLLDAAHTPRSISALVATVNALWPRAAPLTLIFGAAEDKAAPEMAAALAQLPLARVLCVEAPIAGSSERAASAAGLAALFERALRRRGGGAAVQAVAAGGADGGVAAALECAWAARRASQQQQQQQEQQQEQQQQQHGVRTALASSATGSRDKERGVVLVTGSVYVVAEALRHLQRCHP